MRLDERVIDEIVQRVTNAVPAKRIILFGSAANGTMTRDSDVDLLILEQSISDVRAERLKVRQALRDMHYPFDIILMTSERFEETRNVIGGVAYPAARHGRVIHEAA